MSKKEKITNDRFLNMLKESMLPEEQYENNTPKQKTSTLKCDVNVPEKNAPSVEEIVKPFVPEKNAFSVDWLAEELLDIYDFIEVDEQLYVYSEEVGCWKLLEENNSNRELRRIIPEQYHNKVNRNVLSELYEWLIIKAEHKDASVFNNNRYYINFRDVAYNWKDEKTEKKRKKLYFRHSLAIDYPGKKSSTGKFKEFLDGVFVHDKDTRKEFYKFLGLCITEIRHLKLAAIILGPSNTSKSVTLNVIKAIVGENNCSALSFSQFANDFAIAALNGKMINISAEISGTTNSRMDIFKSVTGNDKIYGSRKFKDFLPFNNTCLLVFATNVLPEISDPLEFSSFAQRILIFPFLHIVSREKWDNKIVDHLLKDTGGIIECAISGLQKLEKDNFAFKESEAMLKYKHYYSGMHDSFSLFCDKYIVADKEARTSSSDIQSTYEAFCRTNDYSVLKNNQWSKILKRNFLCDSCTMNLENDLGATKRARGYRGIRLKEPAYKLLQEPSTIEATVVFENN